MGIAVSCFTLTGRIRSSSVKHSNLPLTYKLPMVLLLVNTLRTRIIFTTEPPASEWAWSAAAPSASALQVTWREVDLFFQGIEKGDATLFEGALPPFCYRGEYGDGFRTGGAGGLATVCGGGADGAGGLATVCGGDTDGAGGSAAEGHVSTQVVQRAGGFQPQAIGCTARFTNGLRDSLKKRSRG